MPKPLPVPLSHGASACAPITRVTACAYRIPTDRPEADGTIAWNATILIAAQVTAGGLTGWGYSYAGRGAAFVAQETLAPALLGMDAMQGPKCWHEMRQAVRNIGRSGEAACAISAVDQALWDVKGKLLNLPFAYLIGMARDHIPVYGSGGFTTYDAGAVAQQIESWRKEGITRHKIKIGTHASEDAHRIAAAAQAVGTDGMLFVDANGAYSPRQALYVAEAMAEHDVAWFEEPVSSDDVEGLRYLREHAPSCMDIAAGEYGYTEDAFRRLLERKAVDVLQIDVTRAMGVTGFLNAAALAQAFHTPISSHCAPMLHAALMCHVPGARHIEYFWDHARIETLLFDGVPKVENGTLAPQTERPGFGFIFKAQDAERFAL